jgi:hypothetical protein
LGFCHSPLPPNFLIIKIKDLAVLIKELARNCLPLLISIHIPYPLPTGSKKASTSQHWSLPLRQ